MLRGGSSSNTQPSQPSAKDIGDPLAITVIDSTQSVISRWSLIQQATSAFIAGASKQRDFDLIVIRLDSFPKQEGPYYKSSAFTEDQWKKLETEFRRPGPEGEGTDQVRAMEEVIRAASGNGTEKPSSVVLLYFSDMLVDQPKGGSRASFAPWDTFKWERLKQAGISQAQFYIMRETSPEATPESRAAYRRQEELIPLLRKAADSAGLNSQWILDSVLEDEVAKGRFTGPEIE
jgi:hypothetical protein